MPTDADSPVVVPASAAHGHALPAHAEVDAEVDGVPVAHASGLGSASVVRRHIALFTFTLAGLVILVDQLTKVWALNHLPTSPEPTYWLIDRVIGLRQLRNPGAALGIGYGYTWVLTIVVITIVVVMVRMVRKIRSVAWAIALSLMLGGAVGNLIDRLVQPAVVGGVVQDSMGLGHGAVIDFIVYGNWFVGNVADIAIVIAAGMIVVLAFMGIGMDGTKAHVQASAGQAEDQ